MNYKNFYDSFLILTIFNFVYGFESLNSIKKFNEQSLKSFEAAGNEVMCTYSIALYRREDSNYAATSAVFLNYSPISGLSSIPYPQSSANKTLNFNVKASDSIQVTFSSSFDAFNYGYKIFSQAAGKGQTIVYSPLMTTIANIPNSCARSSCQYSASVIVEQANIVSISVYVNGVAVIYNFSTAILNTFISENFLVSQGDIIQVVPSFAYIGGQFTFDIAFNDGPNNEGNFIWYFTSTYNGPAALESIPNFCGKTDLKLILSDFDYVKEQPSIDIAVVPSFLASTQFPINLSLVCSSYTVIQNRLSSVNTSQNFSFELPPGDLSSCYFIASPIDYTNYPYSESEKMYFIPLVSFVLPSQSLVYRKGENIPVLLETSDLSVTTATVIMNCGGGILQSQTAITGIESYFMIPFGFITFCSLTISDLQIDYFAPIPTIIVQVVGSGPPFGTNWTLIPQNRKSEVAESFVITGKLIRKTVQGKK